MLSSDQSWRTGRGPPGGREHSGGAGSRLEVGRAWRQPRLGVRAAPVLSPPRADKGRTRALLSVPQDPGVMWGPLPSSVSGGGLPPLPLSLTASLWLHPESPRFLWVNPSQPERPQRSGNSRSLFLLWSLALKTLNWISVRPWASLPTHQGPVGGAGAG